MATCWVVPAAELGLGHQERCYRGEMDLAKKFGREIQAMGATIDENAGHRPPETTKHTGKPRHRGEKTSTQTPSTTTHMEVPSNGSGGGGQEKAQPNLTNKPNVGHSFLYQPSMHLMSLLPVQPASGLLFMPPFTLNSAPGASGTWHSGMSHHRYLVVLLPANVRKCYRCGNKFLTKFRHQTPRPQGDATGCNNRLFYIQCQLHQHLLPPQLRTHTKSRFHQTCSH